MPGRTTTWTIRDAQPPDCEPVTDLCLRSKASWGYDESFMDQAREELSLTPARLDRWLVRVAEADGRVLGVAASSIDTPAEQAELELMFVSPDAMGLGVGRALMEDTLAHLERVGTEVLWILSDPSAEGFYLGLGAVRVAMHPSESIPGRSLPWLRLPIRTAET